MGRRGKKNYGGKKSRNIALKRFGSILTIGMLAVVYLMIAAASETAIMGQPVFAFFATLGGMFNYWDVADAVFIAILVGGMAYVAIVRPK